MASTKCRGQGVACSTSYVHYGCRCRDCTAWKAAQHKRERQRSSSRRPKSTSPTSGPGRELDRPTLTPSKVQARSNGTVEVPSPSPLLPAVALVTPLHSPSLYSTGATSRPLVPRNPFQLPSALTKRQGRHTTPRHPAAPIPSPTIRGELPPAEEDRKGVHPVSADWRAWYTPTGTVRLACTHMARMTGRQPAGSATLCPQCHSWQTVQAVLAP